MSGSPHWPASLLMLCALQWEDPAWKPAVPEPQPADDNILTPQQAREAAPPQLSQASQGGLASPDGATQPAPHSLGQCSKVLSCSSHPLRSACQWGDTVAAGSLAGASLS